LWRTTWIGLQHIVAIDTDIVAIHSDIVAIHTEHTVVGASPVCV